MTFVSKRGTSSQFKNTDENRQIIKLLQNNVSPHLNSGLYDSDVKTPVSPFKKMTFFQANFNSRFDETLNLRNSFKGFDPIRTQ